MLCAAVEGFEKGWAEAVANGHPEPAIGSAGILAVTVLTSDKNADAETVGSRASLAARTGCLGVVCAATDLPVVAARAPGILTVVPGIRLGGSSSDDQGRPSGPYAAIRAGADFLVIGRTVTGRRTPSLRPPSFRQRSPRPSATGANSEGQLRGPVQLAPYLDKCYECATV